MCKITCVKIRGAVMLKIRTSYSWVT